MFLNYNIVRLWLKGFITPVSLNFYYEKAVYKPLYSDKILQEKVDTTSDTLKGYPSCSFPMEMVLEEAVCDKQCLTGTER